MSVLNAAAYKFADLTGLPELRERLKSECRARGLKGSILLSPEGINLFIAGESSSVESLLGTLRAIPGLEELKTKLSEGLIPPVTPRRDCRPRNSSAGSTRDVPSLCSTPETPTR
jgi:predicted sulfurtransferase